MASATEPLIILPGQALGQMYLGASIYEILSMIKQDKKQYPVIDLHISNTSPLSSPIVVSLPSNGLRLRFDGADQRLRLIEVIDFRRLRLSYKGSDLTRVQQGSDVNASPGFKRIYQIFGASYPGEYVPPQSPSRTGSYVLSWPGLAFTFALEHAVWSAKKDHVSLLGSNAASPALAMALFEGSSWPEANKDLFIRPPTGPRSSPLSIKGKESLPAEIEFANLCGDGRVELIRRSPAAPFIITLNQTTRQDLITELGPPDATHKREHQTAVPDQPSNRRRLSSGSRPANGRPNIGSLGSSYSSTGTDTFDADFDSGDIEEDVSDSVGREIFWCYFSHGMDILLGPQTVTTSAGTNSTNPTPATSSPHLIVLKVVLHGNVPGSYAFNRHRRLRWTLSFPSVPYATDLVSETKFDVLQPTLLRAFSGVWPESEMGRGKVVNRTWGGSPSDSSFFLPDAGEDLVEGGGSEQWLGNTRLYTFPSFIFEVLENGAVSALTVY